MSYRYLLCAIHCFLFGSAVFAEPKVALSPKACTQIRYLASEEVTARPAMQLSPDGKHIAYVLQTPNLDSDEYEDNLYIAALNSAERSQPASILVSSHLGAVSWFEDNRHLAVLAQLDGKTVLVRVDSVTAKYDIIIAAPGDITDYSMDSAGDTIVIAVRLVDTTSRAPHTLTELRNGYHLDLKAVAPPGLPQRHIYIYQERETDRWQMESQLSFVSPLLNTQATHFVDNPYLHINLSPNGRYLLLENLETLADISATSEWRQSLAVKYLNTLGGRILVSYLYDLKTHKVSVPLKSPAVRSETWAPDSRSFIAVALAPIGSEWEQEDLRKHAPSDHNTHLFSIDLHTGAIRNIFERAERPPLAWTKEGEVDVQDDAGAIHILRMNADKWTETGSMQIPLSDRSSHLPIISDGQHFVVEYENSITAPELLSFDRSGARIKTIAKLNPQADSLLLPRVEHIAWATSTGYHTEGLLLLPPDYDPSQHYPLVIENGSILYEGQFVCDAGADHVSSFVRGILADSGVIYLMRSAAGNEDWKNNYYPKGYPGQIGEAAFQLDLVESAVRYLDSRRMIDPTRVGLIGFSRGGWYTEYALAHSRIHFAAATVTDNVLYSLGEYWFLYNDGRMNIDDALYGGPPYGKSLENWLRYSVSFNLDKIHTPLLMEVMGYGHKDDDPSRPFNNLAKQYEVFVGLSRLARPVDLYYYPFEQHQVDHPMARIAALQRNVDWYRFWLQGYERPNADDPNQFRRWESLRSQQNSEHATAER